MEERISSNEKWVEPKNWDALTVDEKLERMRGVIKELERSIDYAHQTNRSIRRKLSTHEHREGKVVEIKEVGMYEDLGDNGGQIKTTEIKSKFF